MTTATKGLKFRPFADKRADLVRVVVRAKAERDRDREVVTAWLTPKRRVRKVAIARLRELCEQLASPVRGTLANIVLL